MKKAEKLFDKWSENLPKEARIQEVKTLLNSYFEGQWDHDGTSHIVVRCDKLKTLPDYQPFGEITVPVKGGQKVKGRYIKSLTKAINDLRESGEYEEKSELLYGFAVQNRNRTDS